MPYAHFLISLEGGEAEARMNQFLHQNAVLKIDQKFIERAEEPMWAYAVRYENGGPLKTPTVKPESTGNGSVPRIDYRDKLSPEDFSLYLDLKDWRKDRAEKEGTKVFAVFTNAQLAAIAEQKPAGTAELRKIEGVGEGRVEKYGSEVIALVKGGGPVGVAV